MPVAPTHPVLKRNTPPLTRLPQPFTLPSTHLTPPRHEVRAYRDPLCLVQMTPGLAIASGYHGVDEPQGAFDGDSVTSWVANCDVSCDQARRPGHRGRERNAEGWVGAESQVGFL